MCLEGLAGKSLFTHPKKTWCDGPGPAARGVWVPFIWSLRLTSFPGPNGQEWQWFNITFGWVKTTRDIWTNHRNNVLWTEWGCGCIHSEVWRKPQTPLLAASMVDEWWGVMSLSQRFTDARRQWAQPTANNRTTAGRLWWLHNSCAWCKQMFTSSGRWIRSDQQSPDEAECCERLNIKTACLSLVLSRTWWRVPNILVYV